MIPVAIPKGLGVLSGDRSLYQIKHVAGDGGNSNLIAMCREGEEPRFIGFGHPPKGETAAEVGEHLRRKYNERPVPLAHFLPPEKLEAYRRATAPEGMFAAALQEHQLSREAFREQGGGVLALPIARSLNGRRVAELKAAETPAAARALYGKWMEQLSRRGD